MTFTSTVASPHRRNISRRFGDRAPDKVKNNQAFIWLSRGLYEAMRGFVETTVPGKHALRIAAYEFHYEPFLTSSRKRSIAGVDIKVVYDARKQPPRDNNRTALGNVLGLGTVCTERTANASAIAHNKFIVKLEDGQPAAVWTGGTNFSEGRHLRPFERRPRRRGTGHGPQVPRLLEELQRNPDFEALRPKLDQLTPLPPIPPPVGTSVIFSPRPNLDALKWYAAVAKGAREGLFMTFAFGMNDMFKDAYRTGEAPFRLALLEAKTARWKRAARNA